MAGATGRALDSAELEILVIPDAKVSVPRVLAELDVPGRCGRAAREMARMMLMLFQRISIMKSKRLISQGFNRIRRTACTVVLIAGTAGCLFGGSDVKQPMNASVANTSGEGTVDTKVGNNGNTDIDVQVKHLSPPSKVAADASVYVVWVEPHNAPIQNLGALQVDDDLVGRFKTSTPYKSFTLSITPEPSARMSAPTHPAVFTAEVVPKK
jgi:hypothetical protein